MANRCWYAYTSGNPLVPFNYVRIDIPNWWTGVCFTGCTVCAVYAPACGVVPSPFSSNMMQYIVNGLVSCLPQPPVPPANKYYVYMKNT